MIWAWCRVYGLGHSRYSKVLHQAGFHSVTGVLFPDIPLNRRRLELACTPSHILQHRAARRSAARIRAWFKGLECWVLVRLRGVGIWVADVVQFDSCLPLNKTPGRPLRGLGSRVQEFGFRVLCFGDLGFQLVYLGIL